MPTILVVHHSPTDTTRGVASLVLDATKEAARQVNEVAADPSDRIDVTEVNALEPRVGQLRDADAIIFGTTANFGYISGALKHYFDSTFMEIGEDLKGLPMSWWIRGGYDTTGASKVMRSITTGYGWSPVVPPVEFVGEVEPHTAELRDMAQAVVGALIQ